MQQKIYVKKIEIDFFHSQLILYEESERGEKNANISIKIRGEYLLSI